LSIKNFILNKIREAFRFIFYIPKPPLPYFFQS